MYLSNVHYNIRSNFCVLLLLHFYFLGLCDSYNNLWARYLISVCIFSLLFVNFKLVWDHLNYKNVLKRFTGCSIKKLDTLTMGARFSLNFYIIHWIVVIIHDITSLKEYIVFYALWKMSVELVFELKCKLSCLLLRHLVVFFIIINFMWIYYRRAVFQLCLCFHECRLIINNVVKK